MHAHSPVKIRALDPGLLYTLVYVPSPVYLATLNKVYGVISVSHEKKWILVLTVPWITLNCLPLFVSDSTVRPVLSILEICLLLLEVS